MKPLFVILPMMLFAGIIMMFIPTPLFLVGIGVFALVGIFKKNKKGGRP